MDAKQAVDTLLKNTHSYAHETEEYSMTELTIEQRDEIGKLILWQANEIDLLKCCGNCEYWNRTYNQCEEPELIERYGGTGNHSDRDDACDKWKGVK